MKTLRILIPAFSAFAWLRRGRQILLGLALAAYAGGALSAFGQGSLTPPGAPAPTMKKLDEIEPRTNLQATPAPAGVDTSNANYHFVINQPGSYYLSANLLVTKPNGILINAEGVTLDLNGFQISTNNASGNGVEIPFPSHHAAVRDGTVKGFALGIVGYSKACAFRDLTVTGCISYGFSTGTAALFESCRVHDNSGAAAINAATGSVLNDCIASHNTTSYGITAGEACVLTNCAAYANTGFFYGINAGAGSSLTNCSAAGNTGTGPTSAGISTLHGCTLTNCTSSYNRSNAVNTASTGMGFSLLADSTIKNCTADNNLGDGIRVTSDCLVLENSCRLNFAGIHSTDSNNRIEGNNVIANGRGLNVDAAGSLIIKNSASNNTIDYVIAASNRYGPIIDISAAGAPAVSGRSAPDMTTTSHPWANFSY